MWHNVNIFLCVVWLTAVTEGGIVAIDCVMFWITLHVKVTRFSRAAGRKGIVSMGYSGSSDHNPYNATLADPSVMWSFTKYMPTEYGECGQTPDECTGHSTCGNIDKT